MPICPHCRESISTEEEMCPKCGCSLVQEECPEWVAEVADLVKEGKKIEAIKILREKTGLGLKEARDAILDLEKKLGIERKTSGCAGVVLFLFLIPFAWRLWISM